MPCYRFRCTCARDIHEINLLYKDYKEVLPCPCGENEMTRIFDNFNNKEGRTNNQKKLGATEKRIDSGKWMKEETSQRKKDAPPDSQEHQSNEYWLGKKDEKKLSDF